MTALFIAGNCEVDSNAIKLPTAINACITVNFKLWKQPWATKKSVMEYLFHGRRQIRKLVVLCRIQLRIIYVDTAVVTMLRVQIDNARLNQLNQVKSKNISTHNLKSKLKLQFIANLQHVHDMLIRISLKHYEINLVLSKWIYICSRYRFHKRIENISLLPCGVQISDI